MSRSKGKLAESRHKLWCKLDYFQVPWHCRYICSGVVALETFTVVFKELEIP